MIVAIGGSAGSIDALRDVLAPLPLTTTSAVAIVLHVSPHHPSLLTSVLGAFTSLPVREALDKMPLAPATITVAPPDYHLLVERDRRVSLSRDAALHFSRPAIDPLFESVARAAGRDAVGILLSGSNEDGAAGLQMIAERGGRTAVQHPASATSPEMPAAALARFQPTFVGSPTALGAWLANLLQSGLG